MLAVCVCENTELCTMRKKHSVLLSVFFKAGLARFLPWEMAICASWLPCKNISEVSSDHFREGLRGEQASLP